MTFSLSPAVTVSEVDLTTSIPSVASSIGGVVGNFQWGAVNERKLITSIDNLREVYGEPTNTNFNDWYASANFLSYASNLYAVRVVANDAYNASNVSSDTIQIDNLQDFENNQVTLDGLNDQFVARYKGEYGNKISVSWAGTTDFSSWAYNNFFEFSPLSENGVLKEICLVVLLDGVVVESFTLATEPDAKDFNNTNYYIKTLINRTSNYIYVLENFITSNTTGSSPSYTTGIISLSNGKDGDISSGNEAIYKNAIDLFADSQQFDLNFCIQTGTKVLGKYWIDNVCEIRKDCIAIVSPEYTDVVSSTNKTTDIVSARAVFGSSSYAVMTDNYKYQYDRYNDVYRWVSFSGDVAGLMARATESGEAWTSFAGYTNGRIKGVERLAYNPNKAERDLLYKNQVNPIITEGNDGVLILGDKTLLNRPSAFGYYNVRRLFIVIEKAIATASKYNLFDFNDNFTRTNFRNMVNPYLRTVQSRRGIIDFRLVCDTTNNTPYIIDAGQFVADIYVKPNRTIQGINLNFIATKTGVSFEEVITDNA